MCNKCWLLLQPILSQKRTPYMKRGENFMWKFSKAWDPNPLTLTCLEASWFIFKKRNATRKCKEKILSRNVLCLSQRIKVVRLSVHSATMHLSGMCHPDMLNLELCAFLLAWAPAYQNKPNSTKQCT